MIVRATRHSPPEVIIQDGSDADPLPVELPACSIHRVRALHDFGNAETSLIAAATFRCLRIAA